MREMALLHLHAAVLTKEQRTTEKQRRRFQLTHLVTQGMKTAAGFARFAFGKLRNGCFGRLLCLLHDILSLLLALFCCCCFHCSALHAPFFFCFFSSNIAELCCPVCHHVSHGTAAASLGFTADTVYFFLSLPAPAVLRRSFPSRSAGFILRTRLCLCVRPDTAARCLLYCPLKKLCFVLSR
jgi:hypothetical protein